MNTLVQESQIFGPVSSYMLYQQSQLLKIEQYENYQKRSYRNRYTILSTNGPITLSIPLCKGKNQKTTITDVTIAYDEPWVDIHLQTIKSAYGRSPFFDFYYPDIEVILQKKHTHLFQLNTQCLTYLIKKLRLEVTIGYTDSYNKEYSEYKDIRNVDLQKDINFKKYAQVWNEKYVFTPNLSILDLLFCTGPEAATVLSHK